MNKNMLKKLLMTDRIDEENLENLEDEFAMTNDREVTSLREKMNRRLGRRDEVGDVKRKKTKHKKTGHHEDSE